MMNVAFTIWGGRISPVFDAAHDLMIVMIEGHGVKGKHYFTFDPDRVAALISMLEHDRVDVLICGAISEAPARMITESGIQLIPFISGNVERILDAFVKGDPLSPVFLMPGCDRKGSACGQKGACRRYRGRKAPVRGLNLDTGNSGRLDSDSDIKKH
ncbi:MAG: NifB/NifX family molybdenum-iron cluster-binding protein [Proteobacteria bacterium]|nr:NifB/NifX family molybdenum-iron cluster-binding protein [Pseudomonadota bacterium]